MKRTCILIAAFIIVVAIDCFAFDGNRKGFVLGGGIGFTPYAHWSTDSPEWPYRQITAETSSDAVAAQFLIGYAFDSRNLVVFEWQGAMYTSELESYFDEDVHPTHQFAGASWYHYYGGRGSSLFTGAGFGRAGYGDPDNIGTLVGWGYLLGAGYEFSKQVQVGAYFFGAQTSPCAQDNRTIEVGTLNFSLMLTVVAY